MNLLMVAPLFDSKGVLRYFIGAQIDVSGLLKECIGLDSMADLVARDEDPELASDMDAAAQKNEFQSLSEMFNLGELDTVRRHGGGMHSEKVDESDRESVASHRPRLLLRDQSREAFVPAAITPAAIPGASSSGSIDTTLNGKLEGVYQHVRPLIENVEHMGRLTSTVPACSTSAIFTRSVHIALTARTWNPTVAFPVSDRRIGTRTIRLGAGDE